MMLDYFYGQSGKLFAYFRIPKALFQDSRFRQLSTDARTLYGILLDRMSLSAKNGWLDEQGRVYIIYTVREVQESLCCAEHKAVKLFPLGQPVRFVREERMIPLSFILLSLIRLRFWLHLNCVFSSTRIAVCTILCLRFWQSRRKVFDVD